MLSFPCMVKIHTKHTYINLPVELQFRGIPTTWTPGENSDNERVLFPAVSQKSEMKLAPIADPEDIRKQFFKIDELDENSALDFLNGVGVWQGVEDPRDWQRTNNPRIRAMRIQGAFGHRYFRGRAVVATVESLRDDQKHWRELLRNRTKLRAAFSSPPVNVSQGAKEWSAMMSTYGNTLPVHLEWRDKHPHAVIQPITGRELLTALAWIDLVTGAECKVCQNPNCGIEYSQGGRKFCSWQCEHANTMRTYRMNLKEKEKSLRRLTPCLSIPARRGIRVTR